MGDHRANADVESGEHELSPPGPWTAGDAVNTVRDDLPDASADAPGHLPLAESQRQCLPAGKQAVLPGRDPTHFLVTHDMKDTETTPTCVWRITPDLVVALDERFGEPVDAYVNGSQVWLRDDGPAGVTLEWRLHPVAGYTRPPNLATDELFGTVALAIATGDEPPAPPEQLWDGLEAFPAYRDEGNGVDPEQLAAAATVALGIPPYACGRVNHTPIGDEWERSGRQVSIIDALLRRLTSGS
jgi:hypothetical protein